MAEAYKKARLITTTGATNTSGFVGFQNLSATSATISSAFMYGATAPFTGGQSLTIPLGAAGTLYPINCTSITPVGGNVLGFLA
jgi:hypothetical protein